MKLLLKIDNDLDYEKDTENDIKEDFTQGEEINDKKLLGISDSEFNEDQIKEEKTLNNNTNPFIKEENKIKFNEDIEILSEEEKEEKETEEKENEENEKNELQSTNKLYIIDSKFIRTERKINLKNKLFCYKTLNYAGKKYILSTKKNLLITRT